MLAFDTNTNGNNLNHQNNAKIGEYQSSQYNDMQTKNSINNDLKQFNLIKIIIKYVTICCNEAINYFGKYFHVININKYHYKINSNHNFNKIIKDNLIKDNIDDIIRLLLPRLTTKIEKV